MFFKHCISHNRYKLSLYDLVQDRVELYNTEDKTKMLVLTIKYFHANFEYVWMEHNNKELIEDKF